MKLHVLVDNNTIIDRYFKGEPGVSYYIEEGETKILFDVGYSDIFIENAQKMGLDLLALNYIVISHGHIDHTWGLSPLMRLQNEAVMTGKNYEKPTFVAHPEALYEKSYDGEDIGSILSESKIGRYYNMVLKKEAYWLTDKLVFLGQVERSNNFENQSPIGSCSCGGKREADYLRDDSALAYKSDDGLVIITGCSHAGICNIIEYAKKICNEERILDVIGGFHLLNPSEAVMSATMTYFETLDVKEVHACHCTDLASKIHLSKVVNIKEVGVGLRLTYDEE